MHKPDIPSSILQRWQRLVDLMGQVTHTPAALITRALPDAMQMLVSSDNPANPYTANELSPRRCGLYCDRVVSTAHPLLVKNAARESQWQSNPDMALGLSFYLGYPLFWPDGEVFGTLCVLDKKDNPKAREYRDLLVEFQHLVNDDLEVVLNTQHSKNVERALSASLRDREAEVVARANDLLEINTAMRVLIEHQNRDSLLREQQKQDELRAMITPWLLKLEYSGLSEQQLGYLAHIREQLDLKQPQAENLSVLTAMERQVVKAIREGLSSKSIAKKFYLEKSTIDFHRRNIRQKLGLARKRIGLKQYFLNR